jgi:peptide chain release factor subunit 1
MITIKQIDKLIQISSRKYPIISFYLGIPSAFLIQKKYKILAKDLVKDGVSDLSNYNDEQKELIHKDSDRILNFVKYEFDEKSRGLAIFASSGINLWQVFPIPARLKGRFIIDTDPYTRPLVKFLDENEKYFIALVDKQNARFFSCYTGIIHERQEFSEEIQGRHKKGGWSQARFQRHIENQSLKHLDNVGEILYDIYKREKFDHLILGGSQQAVSDFKNIIHSSLQKNIVGKIEKGVDESKSKLFDAVQKVIDNFEKEESEQYLKTLNRRLGKNHLAVSGLQDTVKMLHQARIHTLIVKEDLIIPGYKCSNCETPYTEKVEKCKICGNDIIKVPDIIDEIIEKVWELNGEVKFIKESKQLDNLDGIAALLRW